MKYAICTFLQDELISAEIADYEDYKSFIRCPNCNEVVFLRKEHDRGNTHIRAAFIHHKSIDPTFCEYRVNGYTREEVQAINAGARQQRLLLFRKYFLSMIKESKALPNAEEIRDSFRGKGKLFDVTKKTIKRVVNSYEGRKIWLQELDTETQVIVHGYKISYRGNNGREKTEELTYHDKRNTQIGIDLLKFCLSSQGKDILIAIIPEVLYISCYMIQQSRKIIDIPVELVFEVFPVALFNLFTLNIDWIGAFDKAKQGQYNDGSWVLGKTNNKKDKKQYEDRAVKTTVNRVR